MANNYLQFSVMFPLDNTAQVARALEIANGMLAADDGLGFTAEAQDYAVWIYAEESGDVDAVIEYAAKLGREFKLTGLWGFSYAETCSKMHTDEFGGGAVVVNLKTGHVDYVNAAGWLQEKLQPKKRRCG